VDYEHHQIAARTAARLAKVMVMDVGHNIAHSPYWFVPNLIVGMMCLLLLRKHMQDFRVGMMLLAVNLFWVVNLYKNWWPSDHTEALLAFVFYLWLGAWCAPRIEHVQRWIDGMPVGWLLAAILGTCGMARAEMFHLQSVAGADPGNTLRITNQIFSVCVVIGLMRLRRKTWPKWIDVPAQTYGMYLMHPLALYTGVMLMRRLPGKHIWMVDSWAALPSVLVLFAVTYGMCVIVTNGLLHTPGLEWTVGGKAKRIEGVKASETQILPLRRFHGEGDNLRTVVALRPTLYGPIAAIR